MLLFVFVGLLFVGMLYFLTTVLGTGSYISLTFSFYLCMLLYGLVWFGCYQHKTGAFPECRVVGLFLLYSTLFYFLTKLLSVLVWFFTSGFYEGGVFFFFVSLLLMQMKFGVWFERPEVI